MSSGSGELEHYKQALRNLERVEEVCENLMKEARAIVSNAEDILGCDHEIWGFKEDGCCSDLKQCKGCGFFLKVL